MTAHATELYRRMKDEANRLLAAGVQSEEIAWMCAGAFIRHQDAARPWPRPREHGSERGYQQHRYDDTPACAPCRAAHAHEHRRTA